MPTLPLVLALCAALVHAGWNLVLSRARDSEAATAVALVFGAAVWAPVAAITWEVGAGALPYAAGSAVLELVYLALLAYAYQEGELSVVYPVARGTGPLLSVLAAVLVLGERPGWLGLLGAGLVIAGVLVISTGRTRDTTGARRAGIGYGLLTGVVIAGYTLWDAHSVTGLQVPPVVYLGLDSLLQSVMLAPAAITGRAEVARLWREQRREVLIVGLASPVAYILVLFALTMAPVSLVAPARELSIVLGGLAAWLVLGEQDAVRRLAGSVIVVAGIAAIAAA